MKYVCMKSLGIITLSVYICVSLCVLVHADIATEGVIQLMEGYCLSTDQRLSNLANIFIEVGDE